MPNEVSKNGISPMTSMAVSTPPANANPTPYSVVVRFQSPVSIKAKVKTAMDPNKQTIMAPFRIVDRWLALCVAKIATNETNTAKNPNSKSKS
ncbi:hypothetical protein D3C76_1495960 [compost metagenome]